METKLLVMLKKRGLSQTRLAQLTKIDSSRVCRYVNGSMNPSVRTLERFALALKCNVKEIAEVSREG